ncbi:MAG: hypothetical protein K5686_06860 [Lachnospiraceae bacterium]|nr:hypothetical protein [Lachnospiraceae bacterium]
MALFNQKPTFTPPTGPTPTPVAPAVTALHAEASGSSSLPPLSASPEIRTDAPSLPPLGSPVVNTANAAPTLPPLGTPAVNKANPAPSLPPLGSAVTPSSNAASTLPPLGSSGTGTKAPGSLLPPLGGNQSVGITPTITADIEPHFGEISSQYKPAVLEVTSPGGLLPGMLPLSGKSGSSPISATGGLTGTWSSTGVTDPFHPYGLDGMNGLLPMSTPAESASLPALLPILPTRNTPVIQIFRNDDGNYTAKHVTKHVESRGLTEYEAFMSLLTLIG